MSHKRRLCEPIHCWSPSPVYSRTGSAQHVICLYSGPASIQVPQSLERRMSAKPVRKKSKSRKRHHSLYSGGPHEFKARAGCCSRDVLKESHPTTPRMWHGQKARVGSELGTKARGNRRARTGFWTEARATAIASPHAFEARAGLRWKPSSRAKIPHILENT